MAFRQPALVSRQFNSPIKLYSQENVAETLNKQAQILANGALGIDFHQLSAPSNLANSAVLRMLEEEERGGKSLKRVAWPPPPEDQDIVESEPIYSKGPAYSDQFGPAPIQAAQPSYPTYSAPSAQPPQSYKPSKVASPPLLAYQPPLRPSLSEQNLLFIKNKPPCSVLSPQQPRGSAPRCEEMRSGPCYSQGPVCSRE